MKIAYLGDLTDRYYYHRPHDVGRWCLIYRVGQHEDVEVKEIQADWKPLGSDISYDSEEVLEKLRYFDPDLIYMLNPKINDDIMLDVGKYYKDKLPIVMTCYDLWEPFEDTFYNWYKEYGVSHCLFIYDESEKFIKNIRNRFCKLNVYYDDYYLYLTKEEYNNSLNFWKNKEFDIGRLGRLSKIIRAYSEKNTKIKRSWDNEHVLKATSRDNYIRNRRIYFDFSNLIKNCRYYICTPNGLDWGIDVMTMSYTECLACGAIPYGIKSTNIHSNKLLEGVYFIEHEGTFNFDLDDLKCSNIIRNNYDIAKERFSATSQSGKVVEFFKEIIGENN